MLTDAQKNIIANDLAAKRDQTVIGNNTVWELMNKSRKDLLVKYYNKKTNPAVMIWKPGVLRDEIINAINFSEYINLTAAKRDAAAAFLLCAVFDLTIARVRNNIIDIFGAESDTKAKIYAKCDRAATNLEALFLTIPQGETTGVTDSFGYEIGEDEMREVFSIAKEIIKPLIQA